MPTTETVTTLLLAIVFIALCLYDVPVAWNKTQGDTISEVVSRRVTPNPFLMFMSGLIIGHLLLRARAVSVWSYATCQQYPEIPLALGLIISQVLWAQKYRG